MTVHPHRSIKKLADFVERLSRSALSTWTCSAGPADQGRAPVIDRLPEPTRDAWEGLTPPYATIVADPPWDYPEGWPEKSPANGLNRDT